MDAAAAVVMVVMRWLRVMRHHGGSGRRCGRGCSAAGDGSDDRRGDCVWLVVVLLVQRRLLVLAVRVTDHRAGCRDCSCAVVEVMETVEVVAGRIGGRCRPDAVRWCHGHRRSVRVELVGERGLQFRYGGHGGTGTTATTCHRIHVILAS